jgi:hypothetical protein
MMQDPQKYAKFITNFMEIMSHGGLSRSEDKTFFCGNMHPESMSLCTLAVAIVTGSTSLVTASAIQRVNKSRWTVSPIGCDEAIIPENTIQKDVEIHTKNVVTKRKAVLNYYHMMQGVYALGAALVNTVFTSGLDIIQKELLPDIQKTCVMTTSDDSVRGCYVRNKPTFNSKDVMSEYINRGVWMAPHFMMLDSSDKPIRSQKLAEFNNVAVGPNGMFPQQFVHSHLVMQPLIGMNIIDDIVNCVSNARMSLTWGDSIDMARSALACYAVMLEQKWLIPQSYITAFFDKGLLPNSDEGIIAGFGIKDETLIQRIWDATPKTLRDSVIKGHISPIKALRQYNAKYQRSSMPPIKHMQDQIITVRRAMDLINSSRKIKGRMNSKFFKLMSIKQRIESSNEFMNILTKPVTVDQELIKDIKHIFTKPEIIILPQRMTRKHYHPCTQGSISPLFTKMNLATIESNRFFNVSVTQKPNTEESKIIEKQEIEYEQWLSKYKIQESNAGFTFKSPSGKPPMKFHNSTMFYKSMAFSFAINLPQPADPRSGFTHNGFLYKDFTPCWYSGPVLKHAKNNKMGLAFGYAKLADDYYAFFSELKGQITRRKILNTEDRIPTVKDRNNTYVVPIKRNYSPIELSIYNLRPDNYAVSEFTGDANAIINYGNYLNTNSQRANQLMSMIFKKHNCLLPQYVNEMKPTYPIFHANATIIEGAAMTTLVGYRSVCMLKVTFKTKPPPSLSIDLNGTKPSVIYNNPDEDDFFED